MNLLVQKRTADVDLRIRTQKQKRKEGGVSAGRKKNIKGWLWESEKKTPKPTRKKKDVNKGESAREMRGRIKEILFEGGPRSAGGERSSAEERERAARLIVGEGRRSKVDRAAKNGLTASTVDNYKNDEGEHSMGRPQRLAGRAGRGDV